ncbi:unnamed protein product [Dicrocoelium dendriticum]|nr:unnamed protein product [Dicrocoelium dendriticum]
MSGEKHMVDLHVSHLLSRCNSSDERKSLSLEIAKLYADIQEYRVAKRYLEKLPSGSSRGPACVLLGRVNEMLGDYDGALRAYRDAVLSDAVPITELPRVCQLALDKLSSMEDLKFWANCALSHIPADPVTKGLSSRISSYEVEADDSLDAMKTQLLKDPWNDQICVQFVRAHINRGIVDDCIRHCMECVNSKYHYESPSWFRSLLDLTEMVDRSSSLFPVATILSIFGRMMLVRLVASTACIPDFRGHLEQLFNSLQSVATEPETCLKNISYAWLFFYTGVYAQRLLLLGANVSGSTLHHIYQQASSFACVKPREKVMLSVLFWDQLEIFSLEHHVQALCLMRRYSPAVSRELPSSWPALIDELQTNQSFGNFDFDRSGLASYGPIVDSQSICCEPIDNLWEASVGLLLKNPCNLPMVLWISAQLDPSGDDRTLSDSRAAFMLKFVSLPFHNSAFATPPVPFSDADVRFTGSHSISLCQLDLISFLLGALTQVAIRSASVLLRDQFFDATTVGVGADWLILPLCLIPTSSLPSAIQTQWWSCAIQSITGKTNGKKAKATSLLLHCGLNQLRLLGFCTKCTEEHSPIFPIPLLFRIARSLMRLSLNESSVERRSSIEDWAFGYWCAALQYQTSGKHSIMAPFKTRFALPDSELPVRRKEGQLRSSFGFQSAPHALYVGPDCNWWLGVQRSVESSTSLEWNWYTFGVYQLLTLLQRRFTGKGKFSFKEEQLFRLLISLLDQEYSTFPPKVFRLAGILLRDCTEKLHGSTATDDFSEADVNLSNSNAWDPLCDRGHAQYYLKRAVELSSRDNADNLEFAMASFLTSWQALVNGLSSQMAETKAELSKSHQLNEQLSIQLNETSKRLSEAVSNFVPSRPNIEEDHFRTLMLTSFTNTMNTLQTPIRDLSQAINDLRRWLPEGMAAAAIAAVNSQLPAIRTRAIPNNPNISVEPAQVSLFGSQPASMACRPPYPDYITANSSVFATDPRHVLSSAPPFPISSSVYSLNGPLSGDYDGYHSTRKDYYSHPVITAPEAINPPLGLKVPPSGTDPVIRNAPGAVSTSYVPPVASLKQSIPVSRPLLQPDKHTGTHADKSTTCDTTNFPAVSSQATKPCASHSLFPASTHKLSTSNDDPAVRNLDSNRRIIPNLEVTQHHKDDRVIIWAVHDRAESLEDKNDTFMVQFKSSDLLSQFMKTFSAYTANGVVEPATETVHSTPSTTSLIRSTAPLDLTNPESRSFSETDQSSRSVSLAQNTSDTDKPVTSDTVKPPNSSEKPDAGVNDPLMAKFVRQPGSWDCPVCLLRHEAVVSKCPACGTANPTSRVSTEIQSRPSAPMPLFGGLTVSSGGFVFGQSHSTTSNTSHVCSTPSKPLFSFVASSQPLPVSTADPAGSQRGVTEKERTVVTDASDSPTSTFYFGKGSSSFPTPAAVKSSALDNKRSDVFTNLDLTASLHKPTSTGFQFSFGMPKNLDVNEDTSVVSANPTDSDQVELVDDNKLNFKPVLSVMPEKVEVCTGEENEEVIFCERAKLYRWDSNTWRERGVGELKLLRTPSTDAVRCVMRRDHVLKVCCNHHITSGMNLKPMSSTDGRALTWWAIDFTELPPSELVNSSANHSSLSNEPEGRRETFAVRFKCIEHATSFRAAFENAVQKAHDRFQTSTASENPIVHETSTDVVRVPDAPDSDTVSEIRMPAEVNEEQLARARELKLPDEFYKFENGYITGVSENIDIAQEAEEDTLLDEAIRRGFRASMQPVTSAEPHGIKNTSEVADPDKNLTVTVADDKAVDAITALSSLTNKTLNQTQTTLNLFGSSTNSPSFVLGGSNLPDFSSLSASVSKDCKPLWGINTATNDSPSITWSKAAAPLFSKSTIPKNAGEDTTEESENYDPHYDPVVTLPELVQVKTGEESELCIFLKSCRVYRYVEGAWKDRGIGDMKVLVSPQQFPAGYRPGSRDVVPHDVNIGPVERARLLMRRHQVLKLCVNQPIGPDFPAFKPLGSGGLGVCWFGEDYSEGTAVHETLAVRFKFQSDTDEFKAAVARAQALLKKLPA